MTKAEVNNVLENVQAQAAALSALEKEMGKSKEYLVKVLFQFSFPSPFELTRRNLLQAIKNKDDSGWGPAPDEELYPMGAMSAVPWADSEILFS